MLIKSVPSAEAPLDLLLEADPSLVAIKRYLNWQLQLENVSALT